MSSLPQCSTCHAPIHPGAPEGFCPACLLRAGVELTPAEEGGPSSTSLRAPEPAPFASSSPAGSRRFAGYELLEEIARGGMGVVHRARQVSLDRIVAVKILLFGEFASDVFVRRFRAEAAAAASLHHPNIVAIHEVGEHDGQHYFSMDFVPGQSLAELTRGGPLPARDAATCLERIAAAIHHAHQQGVIHRDLKPSNVLMDPAGQPRITDFGLAKRLHHSGELTTTGQILGSPGFMPPEQADPTLGTPGPAGDIYSLGALLYHLLTGRPPFVAESVEATLRQLLHQEPVAPRLLNAGIPADLETICLKCLEKVPARRYATALAVADELGRFLRNEPIRAKPLGRAQKVWRWARREPVLATLSGSLAAVVLVGLLVTSTLLIRERVARRRASAAEQAQSQLRTLADAQKEIAKTEEAKSRQFAEFLRQMLTRVGPSASMGRDTTLLREVLDQTAERLDRELINQPAVAAELRDVVGCTYCDIGETAKAIAMHREALRLRQDLGDGKTERGAQTIHWLAQALGRRAESKDLDEAESLNLQAKELWSKLKGPTHPKVAGSLHNLGNVYFRRRDVPRARECFEQALDIYRAHNDKNTSVPMVSLGVILASQNDLAGAEKIYQEALAMLRRDHGTNHPTTALTLRNLGDVLSGQGRLVEASAAHAEALTVRASLLDELHPIVADSLERLAAVKVRQKQWAEAELLYRKALRARRSHSPDNPQAWGDDANALADVLNQKGRYEDSAQFLTELIAGIRESDPRVGRFYAIRGSARGRNGRWAEAAKDLETARQLVPDDHWYYLQEGLALVMTRATNAYQMLCRASLEQFAQASGDIADRIALVNLLSPAGMEGLPTVHQMLDRIIAAAEPSGGNPYYMAAKALADCRSGRPADSVARLTTLLADLDSGRMEAGRFLRVQAWAILAMAHAALGQPTEARHALQQARTVAPVKTEVPANGDYGSSWHEWLMLQVHLEEAANLVEGSGP